MLVVIIIMSILLSQCLPDEQGIAEFSNVNVD